MKEGPRVVASRQTEVIYSCKVTVDVGKARKGIKGNELRENVDKVNEEWERGPGCQS